VLWRVPNMRAWQLPWNQICLWLGPCRPKGWEFIPEIG